MSPSMERSYLLGRKQQRHCWTRRLNCENLTKMKRLNKYLQLESLIRKFCQRSRTFDDSEEETSNNDNTISGEIVISDRDSDEDDVKKETPQINQRTGDNCKNCEYYTSG